MICAMEDSVHMHVYIHVPLVNGNQRKKEEGWYFPLSDRVLHCAISVPVLLESEKSNKKNPYIMCINTIKNKNVHQKKFSYCF